MSESDEPTTRRRRIRFRLTRDGLTFFTGLGGIIHQELFTTTERPFLLAIFGTMIGLPAFFWLDEKKKGLK